MVETLLIQRVLKYLDKFLIKKNNFKLTGESYDLILFAPSDIYASEPKYSLIISAKILDNLRKKEVITELLYYFKEVLDIDEYNSITRVSVIHSEDPLVKNMKFVFGLREEIRQLNNISIGGVDIEIGYLVKSLILDKLVENKAIVLEFIGENGIVDKVNAGVIRIEHNFDVVYYTGKGLREIWKPYLSNDENAKILKQKSESFLFEKGYIANINLDHILRVM